MNAPAPGAAAPPAATTPRRRRVQSISIPIRQQLNWSRTSAAVASTALAGRSSKRSPPTKSRSDSSGAEDEGIADLGRQVEHRVLHAQVFHQALDPALAAVAAPLDAAERRLGGGGPVGVDPDRAGVELPRDRVRPGDVLGPEAGGE